MTRLSWAGLLRLGLVELGVAPVVFWTLSRAELMLSAGLAPGREALTRAGLEALRARFPDAPRVPAEME
jgi:uncharacterized phage protein (TIGR02216 family)